MKTELTELQKRVLISEACEWKRKSINHGPHNLGDWFHPSDSRFYRNPPDYFRDLNAIHEAEKVLSDQQWVDYTDRLIILTDAGNAAPDRKWWKTYHATAAQRAEAFGIALGLWEKV